MNPEPLKHCPTCNSDLPVGDFGICRARKDGRNLYCMSCIRAKVKKSRQILREYKTLRKQYLQQREIAKYWNEPELVVESAGPAKNLKPVDKVREVIRKGPKTQHEIRSETKLHIDEIGNVLADLLLWNHEIKSGVLHGERVYFFPAEQPQITVQRKQGVLSGFSSIQAIMPERKRA